MFKRLLVLVVLWVMTLISLYILKWMGVIHFDTSGKIFGIKFKAAGAAAFMVGFLVLLVFLLGKIRATREGLKDFARTAGFA